MSYLFAEWVTLNYRSRISSEHFGSYVMRSTIVAQSANAVWPGRPPMIIERIQIYRARGSNLPVLHTLGGLSLVLWKEIKNSWNRSPVIKLDTFDFLHIKTIETSVGASLMEKTRMRWFYGAHAMVSCNGLGKGLATTRVTDHSPHELHTMNSILWSLYDELHSTTCQDSV